MGSSEARSPTVLISYSHESAEHKARVLSLANQLRADGIDCEIDQYVEGGFPKQGWRRWMEEHIQQADFTIMVCTETYARRVAHQESAGVGRGVMWEADLLFERLYESDDFRVRAVPVLFAGGTPDHVPLPVRGNRIDLAASDGYDQLLRRLRRIPAATKPSLGSNPPSQTSDRPSAERGSSTAAWLVPNHRLSDYFTGRDEVLARVHDALQKRGSAALSGLGGVGKTQAALEYARIHRADYPGGVFWISAENVTGMTSGFVEIAKAVLSDVATEQMESEIVKVVLSWLRQHDRWLVVLDNVDDVSIVKHCIPDRRTGHVLVTTRDSALHEIGIPSSIEVLEFRSEEATQFFLDRTGRDSLEPSEADALRELTAELGYFPLALEQSAAFIGEKGSRFAAYLASFRQRRLELLAKSRALAGDYRETVATTWAANFEAIEHSSPAAADVLRLSAFLHSERIPFEVLTAGAAELGASISAALSDADDALQIDELLSPLSRYSLIRRDRDNRTYTVHRLVQDVLCEEMESAVRLLWTSRSVAALSAAFPDIDYSTWELCERLLPHAQAVCREINEYSIELPTAAEVLSQTAYYLAERGRYAEALPLFERALAIWEPVLGPDHPGVATGLNNLAALLDTQGRYADAQPLYERALAIRERSLGPNDPDVATSLNNLAFLFTTQGRYAEAKPLYERALAISEDALGPDDPQVAPVVSNLAGLLVTRGRYAVAQPLFERALAIRERALGAGHPDVALSLNNLAELFRAQSRYAEAQPLYERALSIWEDALGPDHPDLARGLSNLASLFYMQARYADAQPLFERALTIWERALGPEHREVAFAYSNLAELFRAQGRYAEAEPLFGLSLAIWDRTVGPDHPEIARTASNLALLFAGQGRYAEAETLLERARVIRERAFGSDHPDVASGLSNLAELFRVQGRYAEAQPLYDRALTVFEDAFGSDHPEVARVLSSLALLFRAQGRYTEALPLSERALVVLERALGPDHPEALRSSKYLAELRHALGRQDEAPSMCDPEERDGVNRSGC